MANAIEAPTIKMKKGNIKSVLVQPFQWLCEKGKNKWFIHFELTLSHEPQLPGLFTTIIRAIVSPLRKSIETILWLEEVISVFVKSGEYTSRTAKHKKNNWTKTVQTKKPRKCEAKYCTILFLMLL